MADKWLPLLTLYSLGIVTWACLARAPEAPKERWSWPGVILVGVLWPGVLLLYTLAQIYLWYHEWQFSRAWKKKVEEESQ